MCFIQNLTLLFKKKKKKLFNGGIYVILDKAMQ